MDQSPDTVVNTSVLVIGGSVVGLSMAMMLAARGVPSITVESHRGSSLHPRATGFTARTLEIYRSVGLRLQVPPHDVGRRGPRKVRVASLAGEWFEEQVWNSDGSEGPPISDFSFGRMIGIAQDTLEASLQGRLVELGADVRTGTTMRDFTEDADGVTAHLVTRDGESYTVRASYLVAADGAASGIRQTLGIGRSGYGHIKTIRSVLFRAPLDEYLSTGFSQFTVENDGFEAFLATYHDGRWVLMVSDDEERTADEQMELVRRALGRDDVPIEIITGGRWELGAFVADQFSRQRVFLAGDAAHSFPPNRGGFGANTGIEDAHNLTWKLDAVIRGESSPLLLETYEDERRPVALLRHDQIMARDDGLVHPDRPLPEVELLEDAAMELGNLYRSAAVLGVNEDLPPVRRPDQWLGQPGTRAPHGWLAASDDGEPRSTLDLLTIDWALVATDRCWIAAATAVAERLNVTLHAHVIGSGDFAVDDAAGLARAFGLEQGGASLVRPDGYIAWRTTAGVDDPAAALEDALTRAAFIRDTARLAGASA